MKIVHISSTVFGGAGRAAWRLHEAMLQSGQESIFYSNDSWSASDNLEKKVYRIYEPLPQNIWQRLSYKWRRIWIYPKDERVVEDEMHDALRNGNNQWNCEHANIPFGVINLRLIPHLRNADVIILHWVNGLINLNHFFADFKHVPVIWTLHDMNPFQGLFHYKEDEIRNEALAGEMDKRICSIKQNAYQQKHKKMLVVAPSEWLRNEAQKSKLLGKFPTACIPYSLDLKTFCLKNRIDIRKKLNLKEDDKVILFISDHVQNIRKGFDLLLDALKNISQKNICLLAIGEDKGGMEIPSAVKFVGKVTDDNTMADYFNAADAFVLPSREDNLPNVMLEAFACGCPVIGFPIGGVKEHVIDYETGILAEILSGFSLAEAISRFFKNENRFSRTKIRAYAEENFNKEKQVNSYLEKIKSI